MTLCLHAGGELVTYDQLRQVPTPAPTPTHVPIPHFHLVDVVKHWLRFYGHEVVEEHHAIAREGLRYFGLLTLKSDYGDYMDTLIMRNSADKSFPVSCGVGSRCFCCDNLAFVAEHVVRRKHTAKIRHELPMIVSELVEPLHEERSRQAAKLLSYKQTDLTPELVDHAIMELYRQEVISVTKIADIERTWREPPHQWGGEASVFKLFNCATWVLGQSKVAEDLTLTMRLHEVCDTLVEAV